MRKLILAALVAAFAALPADALLWRAITGTVTDPGGTVVATGTVECTILGDVPAAAVAGIVAPRSISFTITAGAISGSIAAPARYRCTITPTGERSWSFTATLLEAAGAAITLQEMYLSGDVDLPTGCTGVCEGGSVEVFTTSVGIDGQVLTAQSDGTLAFEAAAGAVNDASYLTLGLNGTLTDERVLTAGTGITVTDGGAGTTATVAATLGTSISAGEIDDGATLTEIADDDGTGSGLDADLLDGEHATAFADASHAHAASDVTSGTLDAARLPAMVGDAGAGGTQGAVPAPVAGDATKYLRGDATWQTVSTATPDLAAVTAAGASTTTAITLGGASPLVLDGASAGGSATTISVTDPTGANAITVPDASGTVALSTNKLSLFAATTSAELFGVISDETGSAAGALAVFSKSPYIYTPTFDTQAVLGSESDTAEIGAYLDFRRVRDGDPTDDVSSGDYLGIMRFFGYKTAGYYEGASIRAQVNGTPGANDMPADLVFATSADGSATPTDRLRIDTDGRQTFTATLNDATGDEVAFDFQSTTNKATSGSDTLLRLVQTDTASPGASYLINALAGASTKFYVLNDGDVAVAGYKVIEINSTDMLFGTGVVGYTKLFGGNINDTSGEPSLWLAASGARGGSSGTQVFCKIDTTLNQSGTAAATDLLISRTSTAVGTGAQFFIEAKDDGNTMWSLDTAGRMDLAGSSEPACDATTRGMIVMVEGGAGVADTVRICTKDGADAYDWRSLIP